MTRVSEVLVYGLYVLSAINIIGGAYALIFTPTATTAALGFLFMSLGSLIVIGLEGMKVVVRLEAKVDNLRAMKVMEKKRTVPEPKPEGDQGKTLVAS